MNGILSDFSGTIQNISFVIFVVNVLVHLIFAAGVAKDISNLTKRNVLPQFVPGFAWVLATLLGGTFVAVAYWVMHHSSLARN